MTSETTTSTSEAGTSAGGTSSEAASSEAAVISTSLERILSVFQGTITVSQVKAVYKASLKSYESTMECLLEGPTIASLLNLLKERLRASSAMKVTVDPNDLWQDLLAHYKSPYLDISKGIRFRFQGMPVVDTGGVRRQVFTTIFSEFANNKFVTLFEGPSHSLRPACTAITRSCGLYKILGTMIGHSIAQDGIGFPFLSPACYWYIVGGEEMALEYASVDDVGADVVYVISKVCIRDRLSC